MKRAFTLIEINLAIGVLAVGVLAIVGLYSFAYREGRQSREDVATAAYADAVLGPLVTALSSTNLQWSAFKDLPPYPDRRGWLNYYDDPASGRVISNPEGTAQGVYNEILGKLGVASQCPTWPNSGQYGNLYPALVVMHVKNEAIVHISFRASAKLQLLMAAPLYFTSVRFQGVVDVATSESGGGN